MTKIISKLPVTAAELQSFREGGLKKLISKAAAQIETNFAALCSEFQSRFNDGEWIFMGNKDVYYNNDIFGLLPNLEKRSCDSCDSYYSYNESFLSRLDFAGFKGDLPTYNEAVVSFVTNGKYFRDGGYIKVCGSSNRGLTFRGNDGRYGYYSVYDRASHAHNDNYRWGNMWTIPFFRFGGKDTKGDAPRAILKWFEYDLTPSAFNSQQSKQLFDILKKFYISYEDYLKVNNNQISLDQEKIFAAILAGTEFAFLPEAKKILETNVANASNEFINELRDELLNGDYIRAELDPYDANILSDPNRGHWDLWDYGAGGETAGEILLAENMTARNPADDINHGIVAIDFGTKSTVVVYENERLQILPLQVGSGIYSKGVKAENYENPTVIQFINLQNFLDAYKARAGRPKTKWNDVTVSHTAFANLSGSDSNNYYSFLTGLKQWCGSNETMQLQDRNKFTQILPPFMNLREDDINPLEYYAYYIGLYINNMLQEKRIFLKYIMSFPVSYEKSTREKMRRAFERGLKKSLPTALLSNDAAMKNFIVQDGASEPAAYAITALQEYGFDPIDDEENYYAVFDFGGGTTDFDFGVLRESKLDRYDYSLIHFGENGDRTLGGENLLKLLAFEIFKANQDELLNPQGRGEDVGKIPFTFAADKKDFVGSVALIKDSQEANLNMHNLAEKLRPIWEDPDGAEAKKIFNAGKVEVALTTDKGENLTNFTLSIENLDLKKILRDRIEQGIENFFISMREAFYQGVESDEHNIKPLSEIPEVSIFLAGNSSKSKLVAEIFAEYFLTESVEKKVEAAEKIVEEAETAADTSADDFPFNDEGRLKPGYKLKDGYTSDNVFLENKATGETFTIHNPDLKDKVLAAVEKISETADTSADEFPFDDEGHLKPGYRLRDGYTSDNVFLENTATGETFTIHNPDLKNKVLSAVEKISANAEFPFDDEGYLKPGYKLKDGYTSDNVFLENTATGETFTIHNPDLRDKVLSAVEKISLPDDFPFDDEGHLKPGYRLRDGYTSDNVFLENTATGETFTIHNPDLKDKVMAAVEKISVPVEFPFDDEGYLKPGYKLKDGYTSDNVFLENKATGETFTIHNPDLYAKVMEAVEKISETAEVAETVETEDTSADEFPFDDEGNLKPGYELKDGYLSDKVFLENLDTGETFTIHNPDAREKVMEAVEKISDEKPALKNVPAAFVPFESKAAKILDIPQNEMPEFELFPALGTVAARELQKQRGVEVNPNDIAAPTGKTGVAFGLLKCRDGGNVQITHITPNAEYTPFQFYIGRNKKRKFKTVISKNTKYGVWYEFIDAGNNFDILYSDLPEAVSDKMDVQRARRINVTLENIDPAAKIFLRAVSSNVIEYAVAKSVEELADKPAPEPVRIELK